MVQTVLNLVQFSVMDVDMPAAGQLLALMVQTVQMHYACALRCLVVVTVSLLLVLTILHGTA